MKYRLIQNSFSSGELSTKLDSRTDLQEYFKGVDTLENFLTYRQGGISRRPGFQYQSEIASVAADRDVKLLPFIFSKTESYIISLEVFTTDVIKIRIFDSTGAAVSVNGVTTAHSHSIGASSDVSAGRGLPNTTNSVYGFNAIQSADTLFITHADGVMRPIVISRTASSTFTVTEYLDYYFTDKKAALAHPFQDANIDGEFRITWTGDETSTVGTDITFTFYDSSGTAAANQQPVFRGRNREGHHNSYIRASNGGKTFIVKIKKDVDGIPSVDGLTISSVSSNTLTLSGTHSFQLNDVVTFSGTPPGGLTAETEYFVLTTPAATTLTVSPTRQGTVVTLTNTTSGATCNLVKTCRAIGDLVVPADGNVVSPTDDWSFGSWSNYQGYPRAVTAFEQRLVWGGSIEEPDTLWGSLSANFFHMLGDKLDQDTAGSTPSDVSGLNFFGATIATDPYQFTIASQEINAITWMSSQRALEIGTLGTEYIISGGDSGLSPVTVPKVEAQTSHGSDTVRPVRIAGGTLFISRDGQIVREFRYNNDQGSYITRNLSISSDEIIHHLFTDTSSYAGTKIVDMAYQSSRGILWFVTSNNALVGVTLDYDTQTISWHKHTFGGTSVKVHGLAVIPNNTGSFDDLYISISRNFTNADSPGVKYYLEKIGDDFEHTLLKNVSTNEDDKPYFSDSSKRINATTQATAFTSADAANNKINIASHVYGTGTKIRLTSLSGSTGLSTGTDYFIIKLNDDYVQLATSVGNAFNNTVANIAGTGAGTITPYDDGTNGPAYIIGGFSHLEGEEVEVLADGFYEQQGFVPLARTFISTNVDTSGNTISLPVHNFFPGTKVTLSSSGTLPTGLASDTEYYVIVSSDTLIQLATSESNAIAGTNINITGAGTAGVNFTITPISCKTRVFNGLVGIKPIYTSSGAISGSRYEMIVGLKYTSTVKTMKLEAGQEYGTAQGSLKRNEAVVLKFYRTYGGKFGVGSDEDNLEEIVFRPATHGMGDDLELFTGDKYLDFPGTAERFFQVVVKQDKPLPMSLLGIVHRGVSYDG